MKRSTSQSNEFPPLLTTNLHIPQPHGELVSRSILIDKMDQALSVPLTLISAPAGFGKTTLLSQWLTGSKKKDLRNRAAWVSLESECDLRRFWAYVIAALEGLQSGAGKSALALLDTSQPPFHTIPRILINEISAIEDDWILILDDYDRIEDPSIHAALTFFINNLPTNLHLVVASRSQPPLSLARWRASNQLYELREDDLRFTQVEVATFLNDTKGLNLPEKDVAALERRTEGWIAGLQLVALSMQDCDDALKHSFISDFTGSQRYILDYLVEETLQRQPDHAKTFLLRTSLLERLCASLCNAVTGRDDGQAMLEYLERAKMFTIPLDQKRHWYRYHHLFRDVLRHSLQQTEPDVVFDLHRHAAEWYIQAGRTDDAIRHASAAQAWDQAVELIEPAIRTAWNRGEIRKIITWLGRLPGEHLDSRIHLTLYYSRALLLGGQMEAAEQRLQDSEKVLRARLAEQSTAEDRLQLGTVCAFRTTVAAVSGEATRAQALGGEALSLLPPENIDIRAHTVNSLGVNSYYMGDMIEAVRTCTEASVLAQQVGNHYLVMVAVSYQAKALVCQGQIKKAGQILKQELSLNAPSGRPAPSRLPAASVACASFGNILYEWNRLEEAEHYLNQAIELGQQLAFGSALWSAYHILARIKLVHGDQEGAQDMAEQAQRYRLTFSVPLPPRLMDAEQASTHLILGQLEAAERWAHTYQVDKPASPGLVHEFEGISRARLHLLQDQPEQALSILDRLRLIAETSQRKGHVIKILALTALAQYAQNDVELAINTLHTALNMAEPEGYLRTFVDLGQPMAALLYQALANGVMPDYVNRLLAIFPVDQTTSDSPVESSYAAQRIPANTALDKRLDDPHIEPIIEPLSPRELEVLQLIANGASNQAIAEELIIAIATAKKHVSNIIQKLGVDNRTQAAAKGRHLGLC